MGKALEVRRGNNATLVSKGFARAPPAHGGELLPGRTNLPGEWLDTECPTALHSRSQAARKEPVKFLQVRKARGANCQGLLFRLDDLQTALS